MPSSQTDTVPGFYLGKSASDGNRHLDIVSGDAYSYIDFNKGGRGADYDVRLLVNVENGETQFMWGDSTALTNRKFSVQGEIYQWGSPVALRSEIPTLSTIATNCITYICGECSGGSIPHY